MINNPYQTNQNANNNNNIVNPILKDENQPLNVQNNPPIMMPHPQQNVSPRYPIPNQYPLAPLPQSNGYGKPPNAYQNYPSTNTNTNIYQTNPNNNPYYQPQVQPPINPNINQVPYSGNYGNVAYPPPSNYQNNQNANYPYNNPNPNPNIPYNNQNPQYPYPPSSNYNTPQFNNNYASRP